VEIKHNKTCVLFAGYLLVPLINNWQNSTTTVVRYSTCWRPMLLY